MSETLVGLLAALAKGPHAFATRVTALDADGAVVDTLSWAAWDRKARTLAARLLAVGSEGSRVLVPAMSKLDFHVGFMGCLYAGMVAVPVPQPRSASAGAARGGAQRSNGRLDGICLDSDPCAVLVSGNPDDRLIGLEHLPHVSLMGGGSDEQAPWDLPARALDPNVTALLQYTSGSTSEPRGVVISQGNWVVNRRTTCERIQVTADTTMVLWLPLFHDMGLGNSLVMPIVAGASLVTMEPTTFVREPMVWLRALSHKADVFSSAPDFAFHLCVDRTTPEERATLNLGGCRTVINGSEPVRVETIDRFASAFAPAGFRREAMRPGYGLAESTLGVTLGVALSPVVAQTYDRETLAGGRALRTAAGAQAIELVGCGSLLGGIDAMAVDPVTCVALPDGGVGEIWVDSPTNAAGYWGREAGPDGVFLAHRSDDAAAGPYLRTGDLGFFDEGELFITGRLKDVLIIGGKNYFPQDAESAVKESHPAFSAQVCAAWTYSEERGSPLVVVVETDEHSAEVLATATRTAGIAVAQIVPAPVVIVAVTKGQIPRTTSGKTQRRECARLVGLQQIKELATWSSR